MVQIINISKQHLMSALGPGCVKTHLDVYFRHLVNGVTNEQIYNRRKPATSNAIS